MKPTDKIEKRIQQFEVHTNTAKDKPILESLLTAQAQSQSSGSHFGMVWKAGIVAVAAAMMLTAAVWLSGRRQLHEPYPADKTVSWAQSQTASELTSIMSLEIAFYQGGVEAVEKQLNQAETQMTSKPDEPVTMNQWMWELLNDC